MQQTVFHRLARILDKEEIDCRQDNEYRCCDEDYFGLQAVFIEMVAVADDVVPR